MPPHLERVDTPLRLPRWLRDWLDAYRGNTTRADVIEAALRKVHRVKPPKD